MVKFNIKVVILILLFLNLSNVFIENLVTINSNFSAEAAARANKEVSNPIARLSTGERINSAADDAAGAAISNSFVKKLNAARCQGLSVPNAETRLSRLESATEAAASKTQVLIQASAQMPKSSRSIAGDTEGVNKIEYEGKEEKWKKLNKSIGNPDNFTVSFDYKFTDDVNWEGHKKWKTFIVCTKTINGIQSDHFMIRGHGFSKNFGIWSGKGRQYTRTSKHDGEKKLIDFNSREKHRFTFIYTKEKGCEIIVDGDEWVEDRGITTYKNWGNTENIFDNNSATYTWYVGGDYHPNYQFGKNHPIGVEISNIVFCDGQQIIPNNQQIIPNNQQLTLLR